MYHREDQPKYDVSYFSLLPLFYKLYLPQVIFLILMRKDHVWENT